MSEAIDIKDVYRELLEIKHKMVSKDQIVDMLETMEMMHNHKTMKQIKASEEDIRASRTKAVRGVKDLLAELEQ